MNEQRNLSEEIIDNEYLRERLDPRFGDPLYIHLSDLRVAMELVRTDERVRLLDYGAGGSPYRALFPNAEYLRADYLESPGLNYIVGADSRVDEKSDSFDIVLSTQVLEHVQEAGTYLSEAFRLLKPGGVFICTTHGTYEEHGCPHDFHRWTADGLREEIACQGFEIDKVIKMTTGPRAVMFLMELYRNRFHLSGNEQFGNFVKTMLGTIDQQQANFHHWSDEAFDAYRITDSFEREHAFYIALMAIARKPERSRKEFIFRPHSITR